MSRKINRWSDNAASKIAKAMLRMQDKITSGMNKRVNKISVKRLKAGIIIFCITGVGFSIYLLFSALTDKPTLTPLESIEVPALINKEQLPVNNTVNEELYRRVQQYKQYMDSAGAVISPGLLDSIRFIEELYHSQQK